MQKTTYRQIYKNRAFYFNSEFSTDNYFRRFFYAKCNKISLVKRNTKIKHFFNNVDYTNY